MNKKLIIVLSIAFLLNGCNVNTKNSDDIIKKEYSMSNGDIIYVNDDEYISISKIRKLYIYTDPYETKKESLYAITYDTNIDVDNTDISIFKDDVQLVNDEIDEMFNPILIYDREISKILTINPYFPYTTYFEKDKFNGTMVVKSIDDLKNIEMKINNDNFSVDIKIDPNIYDYINTDVFTYKVGEKRSIGGKFDIEVKGYKIINQYLFPTDEKGVVIDVVIYPYEKIKLREYLIYTDGKANGSSIHQANMSLSGYRNELGGKVLEGEAEGYILLYVNNEIKDAEKIFIEFVPVNLDSTQNLVVRVK